MASSEQVGSFSYSLLTTHHSLILRLGCRVALRVDAEPA
ncbi:hypothetical protein ACVWYQ_001395 [Bradyrhizobium sp. USDA 3397]